jgi:hypothetical protein
MYKRFLILIRTDSPPLRPDEIVQQLGKNTLLNHLSDSSYSFPDNLPPLIASCLRVNIP